jgi:hypothetical protein
VKPLGSGVSGFGRIRWQRPTVAQQTKTPDPQLRQRLLALIKNFDDAYNDNDAVTLAALFSG